MDRCVLDILNHIVEGIVILNDKLEIFFWNKYMEDMLNIKEEDAKGISIFEVFPRLNKPYFINTFNKSLEEGNQYFFSSKIHKNLISDDLDINLKITKLGGDGRSYLMIEFLDITNQCIRINQLKEYANELWVLNRKLQEKEKEIEKLAYYDSLTNVGNRMLFYSISKKLLASAKRNNNILGLMFVDIDRFKDINDRYGHVIGDEALVKVADILTQSIRETDFVARYGGDEFIILLPDLKDYKSYEAIVERMIEANRKIKINEDIDLKMCLSIGISFYPRDGKTIDELMVKADKAMYRAKQSGGDRCTRYEARD